jgi:hypothetical protein
MVVGLAALIVALGGLATYGFAGATDVSIHPMGSALASSAYLAGGYFLIKKVALKG